MSLQTSFKGPSGAQIPAVGLGTWKAEKNAVAEAVKFALQNGYKHIDGAAIYGNETEVGEGIRQSGVKREDIWVTSKLWNDSHHPSRVRPALEQTLKDLGLKYVDLYLMHWPLAFEQGGANRQGKKGPDGKTVVEEGYTIEDTWKEMETLVEAGLAKNIGISNFTVDLVKRLLKVAKKDSIFTNQVELHPYLPQPELVDFLKKEGIVVTAYSPLGSGSEPSLLKDKTVLEIAEKHKLNAGQVLISWAVQRGTVAIPKSSNPDRIKSNFHVKQLTAEDFEKLNNLHKTAGTHRVVCTEDMWGVKLF